MLMPSQQHAGQRAESSRSTARSSGLDDAAADATTCHESHFALPCFFVSVLVMFKSADSQQGEEVFRVSKRKASKEKEWRLPMRLRGHRSWLGPFDYRFRFETCIAFGFSSCSALNIRLWLAGRQGRRTDGSLSLLSLLCQAY